MQAITGEPMEDKRIDQGTVGEGLGCLVGALFGGTPMTGYSSNAVLIAITKVASRRVVIAGAQSSYAWVSARSSWRSSSRCRRL